MTWCRMHFTFRHGVIFWHGYSLLGTHCMSESTCIYGLSYVDAMGDARVNLEPTDAYSDDI